MLHKIARSHHPAKLHQVRVGHQNCSFSLVTASANRAADKMLAQGGKKNQARMSHLFEDPTFEFPKPDFSIIDQSGKHVTKAHVLKDTPADLDPFKTISADLASLNGDVRKLLSNEEGALGMIARYLFEASGGKRLRAGLVMLIGKALTGGELRPKHRRLAEITEMIHTASLLHDDVIDDAETRRGMVAAQQKYGNKRAILGGDLLLARSSVALARLRNLEAVEALSTVVGDMVKGEVMQLSSLREAGDLDENGDVVSYLTKNYYKTGSLIANSCISAVFVAEDEMELSEKQSRRLQATAFRYGEALGHAFQLVDDALDFEGSFASLGKPSLADVKLGIATYPVLAASRQYPELIPKIERRFREEGDVEFALRCVMESDAIPQTRQLALRYCKSAADHVREGLPPSVERDALVRIAAMVAERQK